MVNLNIKMTRSSYNVINIKGPGTRLQSPAFSQKMFEMFVIWHASI